MDPDLALYDRWCTGDQAAGQELFSRHFQDVYRFFKYKTDRRDGSTAEDLAQQTFMKCVRARDQFRRTSSFRTYLFTIARNELYHYLRALPRAEFVDLEVSSLNEVVSSPSHQLARQQERDRLAAVLRELPVEQQVLLELHYWHDLDAAALAEVLDAEPGAIRVRLHRARRLLHDRLTSGVLDDGSRDALSVALREPDAAPGDAGS